MFSLFQNLFLSLDYIIFAKKRDLSMKKINYAFVRAICALVAGVVLVMFPSEAGNYFVITIGAYGAIIDWSHQLLFSAQGVSCVFPCRFDRGRFVWFVVDADAWLFCQFPHVCLRLFLADRWYSTTFSTHCSSSVVKGATCLLYCAIIDFPGWNLCDY